MRENKRDIPRIPLPRPSAYPEVSSSTWKKTRQNRRPLSSMQSARYQAFQSAKLLEELYDIAKELSEDEQLFLLDTVKALKLRLGKRQ